MNSRNLRPKLNRLSSLESLEHRVLLDGGLGNEIANFATEDELQSYLVDKAAEQNQWLFGREKEEFFCIDWCWEFDDVNFNGGPLPVAVADGGGAGGIPSPDASDTNVQVAGVDEGDIVETDGNYVYILSGNEVTIVDVQDQAVPRIASRIDLPDNAHGSEMYLDGDRLMVVASSWGWWGGGGGGGIAIDFAGDAIGLPFYEPQENAVKATVIDVTDREAPSIVSTTEIEGYVSNSRAIDGTVFMVVDDNANFPTVLTLTEEYADEDGNMRTREVYESEEAYRGRIESIVLDDALTEYTTFDASGNEVESGLVADFDSLYRSKSPSYQSLVSVVTIDMHDDLPTAGDDGTTIMMQSGHQIYMDLDSLYLMQATWDVQQTTSIMKFDINTADETVTPTASGRISGNMLNQFSADERDGFLRIATTTGWGEESSSGVYVLEQIDDRLTVKGGVSGLAPGERIFSARFVGDRGYIVTFRQVDPLFSINLADPANPIVEGELKIPGFSEYLQPIDENHLLAIGRDADPRTGRAEELQLSLFNVEDITDPQLVDRFSFDGGNGSYSPAEHDHHAFGYYPEYSTLAVPVQSGGGGTWLWDGDDVREWIPSEWNQSLHVFTVDVETGFDFVHAIQHPSQVQRSLRVGDALYSVSYDTLKVNSITDPTEQLGMVHFQRPQNGGVVPIEPGTDDIDRIFAAAATEENDRKFDLDGNSVVNTDDVTFIVEAILETAPGDANIDGKVDFADFLALAGNFGQEGGWADGDFDGDGEVGFGDFAILSENFTS